MECSSFSNQDSSNCAYNLPTNNTNYSHNQERGYHQKDYSGYCSRESNPEVYDSRIRPDGLLARMTLPCQTYPTWNYEECYSYYANGCYNTCQFVEMGDIEDFM